MRVVDKVGKCLLQEILDKKHMTQVDLSIKTGITATEINLYIHNERCMSLRNARRIAIALNCKLDDLYDWNIK
jgi:DNA-binding Xre family transcriptional regulator